jgi:uncharacterized HAD superfamily protein
MRIGVDADGVLADFDKSMVDGYNRSFDADLEYKQITHWDAFESLTGWTHDEWWDWVVKDHQRVFLDAPPLPGAVEGMRALKDAGHELAIISAKPKWAAGHMIEWLHQHEVPYDEIHITSKKSLVICDVYIDDALHNVVDLLENAGGLVIQYSAWPYVNEGKQIPGAVYAKSWDRIINTVLLYDESNQLSLDIDFTYSVEEV